MKKFLIFGLVLFLTGCVATVDNQFRTEFPLGKVMRDKVTLPKGDVLLPPGDWTILATEVTKNNTHHSIGNMALGRIDEDGFLRGFVTITSALDTSLGYSFYSSSFCDRQPKMPYHQTNANVDLGKQSCFGVAKKALSAFSYHDEYVKLATSNLYAMKVDRPYDMISAAFRISRRDKLLLVEYGFDYRQDADVMVPGYATGEPVELAYTIYPKANEANVKAVVRWARANADRIEREFLD